MLKIDAVRRFASPSPSATFTQFFHKRTRSILWYLVLFFPAVLLPMRLQAQDIDLTGYTLTWSDEFTESVLNFTDGLQPIPSGSPAWIDHTPWNGDFGDGKFVGSAFSLVSGTLRIKAWNDGTRWYCGLLSSVDQLGHGFRQQYGYFEAKMKFPGGTGTWPAFWLSTYDGVPSDPSAEIDVVEFYGNALTQCHQNLHCWVSGTDQSPNDWNVTTGCPDLTAGDHIYGVLVKPDYVTYYLDGQAVHQLATPSLATQPLCVLLDYALGAGYGESGVGNPSYTDVDWVRVYQAPAGPSAIILDNSSSGVTLTGTWQSSTSTPGYYERDYLHDQNTGQGTKNVKFQPNLPVSQRYEVFTRWTAYGNRSTYVPIDIVGSSGTSTVVVNQQVNGSQWVSLGTYSFTSGTSGYVRISNTGANGYVIADAVEFVPRGLPSPWVSADVGSVGVAGSASYANGVFTLVGSGAGFYSSADSFQYVYQPVSGDCTITARVATANAEAGVMIRETLNAGATFFSSVVEPTDTANWRRATTGSGATVKHGTGTAPYWVRAKRVGSLFTAWVSSDGNTWTQVGGGTTISMASPVYIGLVQTSNNNTTLGTSTLDNVTVSTP